MATTEEIKKAFITLGKQLSVLIQTSDAEWANKLRTIKMHNPWFTEEQLNKAFQGLVKMLDEQEIEKWLESYDFKQTKAVKVGIIMAGNIPLVGFHDWMCVLMSGNKALIKLSSDDRLLLPELVNRLENIEPKLKGSTVFVERLNDMDAVIATGSNNSARYFNSYFGKYPHIIRKNRNSVAVLNGKETNEELTALGNDIFSYFGMGCRNVSKLYVPHGYDFDKLFQAIFSYQEIVNHNKYANNYDYNKAVYLMNLVPLMDNGFLLLKHDETIASPIGVVFYEYYTDADKLKLHLEQKREEIQCIVGEGYLPFGTAQCPGIADYADGVDTMRFLESL